MYALLLYKALAACEQAGGVIERVYIALGANLGDPAGQLRQALVELQRAPGIRLGAIASLYRSPAIGVPGQADFLNSAAGLDTALGPERLLALCKEIEWGLGRRPGLRWGPRVVDLDILLFGERQLDTASLQIPHPELTRRDFVLEPLAELCPAQVIPGLGMTVQACLEARPGAGLERVAGPAAWGPEALR